LRHTAFALDGHGNITFLTDTAGAVTDSYDYDAWGILVASTGSTPNTRLYACEELDPDLGLINLRARQYKPNSGRFATIDPLTGEVHKPTSFNKYIYTSIDPVNAGDPLGTSEFGELVGVLQFGSRVQNVASAAFLRSLSYVANLAAHGSGSPSQQRGWTIISTTAGFYAKVATAAATMPFNPAGVYGVGNTVSCMLAVSVIEMFGGDPGEIPNLRWQYPCVPFDPLPPIPPFS